VGKFEESIAEYEKGNRLDSGPWWILSMARAYAKAGKRIQATKALLQVKELAKRRYLAPVDIALIHAALGDRDRAFQWLETGYEDRHDWVVSLKVDPMYDSLRSDPRFQDLLQRMKFPD
jgi:serine/threonine-protein kinase